jgi:hypothetical protein
MEEGHILRRRAHSFSLFAHQERRTCHIEMRSDA